MKSIATLFIMLMMLQSCTIYKKGFITLDQAVQNESRVKIQTKNDEKIKLKKIVFENERYYGVNKVNDETVKIPLDEKQIKTIQEKNKSKSTTVTILTSIGVAGGIFAIIAASTYINWLKNPLGSKN